jgi:hypothetical protein
MRSKSVDQQVVALMGASVVRLILSAVAPPPSAAGRIGPLAPCRSRYQQRSFAASSAPRRQLRTAERRNSKIRSSSSRTSG